MTDLDLLLLRRRVDQLLAPWNRPDQPGMTIGVVRDGALVVHRQAGMASLELGVPIGPETCFRIASVSKQFTCAALLMLAAEGRIDPEDEARRYVPELPDYGERITVAHLMHNTSGLRDMLEIMRCGGVDLTVPCRREDLLEGIWRQGDLNFSPGSRYLYSNTNFLLLGLIVERLSGMGLPAFLGQRIFAPLGMTRTRMTESTTESVPGLATGYLPRNGRWARAAHGFPLGGEGGLVSCVEDLALWASNMETGRVGGKALAEALQKRVDFTNGAPHTYARGLQVREYRGLRVCDHGGLWPGYRTQYMRMPEMGLVVICIANSGIADPFHTAQSVVDAVIDGKPGVIDVPKLPGRAELERWAGRWLDQHASTTIDISINEAGLPMANTYGVPFRLKSDGNGRLVASHAASDFSASLSDDGQTLTVELDAGATGTYHRVAEGAALPADLAGRYDNPDMAADWTFCAGNGAMRVAVNGPKLRGTEWEVEPIEGDIIRVLPPGILNRSWMDVRVERNGTGAITGLAVAGGRARRLVFSRKTA